MVKMWIEAKELLWEIVSEVYGYLELAYTNVKTLEG